MKLPALQSIYPMPVEGLPCADGKDISCGMRLLTSNPPKRALSFTLDDTHYVALVTITADPPALTHADLRKPAP